MKDRIISLLQRIVARRALQPLWEKLHKAAILGMNISGGASVKESGEYAVLQTIRSLYKHSPTHTPVIFDIGAHTGTYAHAVTKVFGNQVDVYCFEPSATTFQALEKSTDHQKNIHLLHCGMSDHEGTMTLYSDGFHSGLASVYQHALDYHDMPMDNAETVQCATVDTFCRQQQIEYIDLMKIDVEGHEMSVLQGASSMIGSQSIRFIQFEIGPGTINARSYLRDFFEMLSPHYEICRIVKDGWVPIRRYRETHEHFLVTNYIACLRKTIGT